jgi:hypothetical protein
MQCAAVSTTVGAIIAPLQIFPPDPTITTVERCASPVAGFALPTIAIAEDDKPIANASASQTLDASCRSARPSPLLIGKRPVGPGIENAGI